MTALVVQSRFAGLKIEDEDYPPSSECQKSKKIKTNTAKKSEPQKKTKSNTNKPQNIIKKKKPKANSSSAEQWELWKQKDEELVDGNFETELEQALLLSKLDYEENKDIYKQRMKAAEIEKKIVEPTSRAGVKKQKKKNIMSLDQFNDMVNTVDEPRLNHDDEKESQDNSKSPDKEFFDRIKGEAKDLIIKDKFNDKIRHRQTVSDETITRVQFADALEKKEKEIAALRLEVTSLKQELLTVKSRNKKLCHILGQGEMKDKAEVLVEVERLRAVQAELTAELAALHTDLEKERSRNTDPKAKDKKYSVKKKNIRFDVSSQAILSKESSSGTT